MTSLPPKAQRVLVYLIVLIPYFGVGMLAVRVAGEQHRTQEQLQVDCPFYGLIAGAPLPRNANDLSVRIVQASRKSYDQRGCQQIAGPLPSPSSTPTPSR